MRHAPLASPRAVPIRVKSPYWARLRVAVAVVGAVACVALVVEAAAEPSWAASPTTPEPAALGGFALGDGVEGMIEPRTGDVSFTLPVAGLSLRWDSRVSANRFSLGRGWAIGGLPHVEVQGGVRVAPASGGEYPADASVPSGLAGYRSADTAFRQHRVEVPARADGLRGAQEAAFTLTELGGITTYFNAQGDPIARVDPTMHRTDWEWAPGHRLIRVTDPTGVVATLDWSDPSRVDLTAGLGDRQTAGAVQLTGGRVAVVVDATGARFQLGYTDTGLVQRMAAPSGASTEIAWQRLADGRAAVDRIRLLDAATGAELSARSWTAPDALATGWPQYDGEAQLFALGAADDGYQTTVTDDETLITSTFDHRQRLIERETAVGTPAGRVVVQRQAYTYPAETGGDVPPQFGRPTEVTVTHLDAAGGRRATTETFESDALGRIITQVDADGSRTEIRYDDTVTDASGVPIGAPIRRRVTTPDGLVEETRHELDPTRTIPIVTETYTGSTGGELVRTGREEFDLDADGFVREHRVFGQADGGQPVVTSARTTTDRAAGTVTTVSTAAAGTEAEATSTTVVDGVHGGTLRTTDAGGATNATDYDDAGRPVRQTDAAGNVTRIEYRTAQLQGENATTVTGPDGVVRTSTTDVLGRITATTDIARTVTRFERDRFGIVTAATQTSAAGERLAGIRYAHDAFGRLTELARDNGVTTTYAYTSANEIAHEVATRADGTTLSDRVYDYDARGRLSTRVDTVADSIGADASAEGRATTTTTTTSYTYDAFDRLTGSTVHDGASTEASVSTSTRYELSVSGDIRAEHVTERPGSETAETTTRAFEYGPTGTLLRVATIAPDGTVGAVTQEYDAAGNVTRAIDGTTYAYNALNQPITETTPQGATIGTTYWSTGQRAARTTGAGTPDAATTTFHWDGTQLRNDTHTTGGSAAQTASYLIGTGRHARSLGAEASVTYYEADFHGNVTELTGADGEIVTRYRYSDYGRTAAAALGPLVGDAARNPFQYAGEYTDATGTQHLQARTYDPESMRLTSVDPELLHNRYHYAALNPITLADPSGHLPELPPWAVAVIAGAGLAAAGIGLAAAVGGFLAVAATTVGGASTSLQLALGASIVVAAGFDLTATALTTAQYFVPKFLDPTIAFGLGLASAAVGGTTLFAGAFAVGFGRAIAGRTEIGKLMAQGARQDLAEQIVATEQTIASEAKAVLDELAEDAFSEETLRRWLNAAIGEQATIMAGGKWDALIHLKLLDEALVVGRRVLTSNGKKRFRIIVTFAVGDELRTLSRAERYAAYLKSSEVDAVINTVRSRIRPQLRVTKLRGWERDGTKHGKKVSELAYPGPGTGPSYAAKLDKGYDLYDATGLAYVDPNRQLDQVFSHQTFRGTL